MTKYEITVEEKLIMEDLAACEVIDLRDDVSCEEAKREIKAYFEAHHGEKLNAVSISVALRIDDEIVTRVLDELEKEGQILEIF
jgi:hypothetical protein